MARFIPSIYSVRDPGIKPKVIFGIPIPKGQTPHPVTIKSLEDCLPAIEAAGWEHGYTHTTGNPYISGARAEITRKALDKFPDAIVYLDYDVAWQPQDMVALLKAEDDVVAGTYRCKTDDRDEELYMGAQYTTDNFLPVCREDGCIKSKVVPAGFLKVTVAGIDSFMRAYPELCYGPQYSLSIDLFQHGAHEGLWWGEDYAFCRNYEAKCGPVWLLPNVTLDHWTASGSSRVSKEQWKELWGLNREQLEAKCLELGDFCYRGNFHEYMLRQPGGSKDPARLPSAEDLDIIEHEKELALGLSHTAV